MIQQKQINANDLKLIHTPTRIYTWRIGERAYLNSGSPPLTVVDITDKNKIVVSWKDKKKMIHEMEVNPICLNKVNIVGL